MTTKCVSVLGSTGSIGTQTLQIAEEFPEQFRVVALSAGRNLDVLEQQVRQHRPQAVALAATELLPSLRQRLSDLQPQPELMAGAEGVAAVAAWPTAQLVVTGIVGCAGLLPTMAAVEAGKDLALANKETLIAAGPVVLPALQRSGSCLLPADSEHSAIFQCLQGTPQPHHAQLSTGVPTPGLRRILLTASGGAFRTWEADALRKVTVADAIQHPNWSMGRKITVDSATLMNKGLEVIEAHYLFGMGFDHIEVVIHPQSIVHSMVELEDSSVLAQLGWPDMRLPLLYALSWPQRLPTPWRRLDLAAIGQLNFAAPDARKYPCLDLAYTAGRQGGTMPAVLNAANEQAVALFLEERIRFLTIPRLIEQVCDQHRRDWQAAPDLDLVLQVDGWARRKARELQHHPTVVP